MKRLRMLSSTTLLVASSLVFAAGESAAAGPATSLFAARERGQVLPAKLALMLEAGDSLALVDVRSRREYAKGHIPGAVNIPFRQIDERLAELPCHDDRPLVLYCGHGPRAWLARRSLRRLGINDTLPLKGHFSRWKRLDLPLEHPLSSVHE